MIVYVSDKLGFKADVLSNRIEEIILASFVSRHDRSVGPSEIGSWEIPRMQLLNPTRIY
jgi:hypothetical protein